MSSRRTNQEWHRYNYVLNNASGSKIQIKLMKTADSVLLSLFMNKNVMCTTGHAS